MERPQRECFEEILVELQISRMLQREASQKESLNIIYHKTSIRNIGSSSILLDVAALGSLQTDLQWAE